MSLKLKISLFSVMAILALSALLLGISSLVRGLMQERYEASIHSRDQVVWSQVIDQQTSKLALAVPNFTRNSDLIKAINNKEYDKAGEFAKYIWNRLVSEGVVEKIILVNLEGEIISSAPEAAEAGLPSLFQLVSQKNEVTHGLMKAADGQVKLAYAFPVFFRGKPVAYAFLLQNLDSILDNVKKYIGADVLLMDASSAQLLQSTTQDTWDMAQFGSAQTSKPALRQVEKKGRIYEISSTSILGLDQKSVATLVTLKDYTDAFLQEKTYKTGSFLAIAAGIVVFIAVMFVFLRQAFRPLAKFGNDMQALAEGNMNIALDTNRRDEIAPLARAVELFKDNAIKKMQQEQERKYTEQQAEEARRKQFMSDLAGRFETKVQGIIQSVSTAATQLCQSSEAMSDVIGNASQKADSVSRSSGETLNNVQAVAAATEEMSASVHEIASQIVRSSDAVRGAVTQMQKADETSKLLDEATNRIGEIVDLIQNIAGQINLLALNATIESARAGEAGKGFAVVAGEVKRLASQTAHATADISQNVGNIKAVSDQVIQALSAIRTAIRSVDEISSSISSAVEEQSAVTNEIAQNMSHASNGTSRISQDIDEVSRASALASTSAQQTLDAAKTLSAQAQTLNTEVSSFLREVRHG